MAINPDELRAKGIKITPELIKSMQEQTAQEYGFTMSEFNIIRKFNKDRELWQALSQLKKEDIVEFNMKLAQMKLSEEPQTDNTPKCPTCGSTNIKKISGAKRWLTTGILGLASSNVGKTMECNNCGCKW